MRRTNLSLRALTLLACAACAVGMTAGCNTSATDNAKETASQASSDDYLLKFTRCLRGKGIDVPDPDSKGNLQIPQSEAANKAAEECDKEAGPAPGSEEVSGPEAQQNLVKAAQCLRKEGYDVPDPEVGKGIQLNDDIPQETLNKCLSDQEGN